MTLVKEGPPKKQKTLSYISPEQYKGVKYSSV